VITREVVLDNVKPTIVPRTTTGRVRTPREKSAWPRRPPTRRCSSAEQVVLVRPVTRTRQDHLLSP